MAWGRHAHAPLAGGPDRRSRGSDGLHVGYLGHLLFEVTSYRFLQGDRGHGTGMACPGQPHADYVVLGYLHQFHISPVGLQGCANRIQCLAYFLLHVCIPPQSPFGPGYPKHTRSGADALPPDSYNGTVHQLQVRRGRSADADQALALWQECFPAEWAADALHLSGVRRVVRFLLSFRRSPLRMLRWLGSAAEFWVGYEDERLAVVMGQLGEQLPRLTGLVLRGDLRGTGLGKAFLEKVLAEHDRSGTEYLRALPAQDGWGRRALTQLGFVELGQVQDYELPLPLPASAHAEGAPRWLRRKDRRAMVRAALEEGDLARAVTVDGTYGAAAVSLLGLREAVVTDERGALGLVEYNSYQAWAQLRLCQPKKHRNSVSLIQGMAEELARGGVRKLRIALWEQDTQAREAVGSWGASMVGQWTWVVRRGSRG